MDGSDEYQIVLEATMTKSPPTSYTDCHSHGSDTYVPFSYHSGAANWPDTA